MKKLQLSKDLSLPLDVVTQKLGWIGTTGSGKTYGASKLAELMWHANAQFIVLDPVGVWYGLRLAKDGKHPSGIPIPIFGGLHGDVPLESTAGAMMADLVVDRALTCILDVSQFESDAQKARFAADFADRFFFRKKAAPSAVHVFIEECQEFVPEHQQRGEERMLHAFVRLQKIGRNFGIGTSYITQRPQEVAKKALNLAQTLFVFRTTGAHERAAIERWIKDKAIDGQDISAELPKLKTGAPHVWSPEWLELSEVVPIEPKLTFNASATPEVGAATVNRDLTPIDLERIRKEMSATIERAKADDPKELKKQLAAKDKRISELERDVKPSTTALHQPSKPAPALTDADRALIEKLTVMMVAASREGRAIVETAGERLKAAMQTAAVEYFDYCNRSAELTATRLTDQLERAGVKKLIEKLNGLSDRRAEQRQPTDRIPARGLLRETRTIADRKPAANIANSDGVHLKKMARNILSVLAQYPGEGCRINKIAQLTGYRQSGGFYNELTALRNAGFMVGENTGVMCVTAEGLKQGPFEELPSGQALVAYWLNHRTLKKMARQILAVLVKHPGGLTKDEIVEATGYQPSGGFFNELTALRNAGVMTGKNTEIMRISDELAAALEA